MSILLCMLVCLLEFMKFIGDFCNILCNDDIFLQAYSSL
ncbi:unknown [[Mannheimia] succiniciproducens MBEL55E]|uniref:Uncharacterized protein n=1 Tax=Mannheimia succiniciproducens (strain KCTC 0769BP / MBEL55E) TaxID=221988 RepID=Q65TU5_MANSM|nr:unknown [[Mannheimia] succiniciproducens MBEL55E]